MIVEINGFDESGIIGGNLRFVRVGLNEDDELRFYIYNILHFGSVVVTKNGLCGLDDKLKIEYIKNAFSDPSIEIDHYYFPPLHQLELLRYFAVNELFQVALRRNELIQYLREQKDLDKKVSRVIDRLKKYTHPAKYTEWYIKSYAYKSIFTNLEKHQKL